MGRGEEGNQQSFRVRFNPSYSILHVYSEPGWDQYSIFCFSATVIHDHHSIAAAVVV